MLCPNCNDFMQPVQLDGQEILHCPNCGGSFFVENGINRISIKGANLLEKDKKNNVIIGKQKSCPKDSIFMELIHEESIPQHVTLFKCPKCNGVFAYAQDLVDFKHAQHAKLAFFKTWGTPLPSLKSVLVLSMLALMGALLASNALQNRALTHSNAQDIVKTVFVTHSGRYVFINFTTPVAVSSQIVFIDETDDIEITKPISSSPSKTHTLTTTDLDLNHQYSYYLLLTDKKGNVVKTEKKRLEIEE